MADVARREPARLLGGWWFAACALALIFASDYKFRARDPREALAAGIDLAIVWELALYAIVAAYLVIVYARPPKIRRLQPHLYLATLFVGLMVLSVVYTAYPEYALVRALQMCVLLGLVLVAARAATLADFHRFAHAYIVLVGVSVVYGVLVPSPPISPLQEGRFTWLAIHPTVSGVLAGLATVLVVAYLAAGNRSRPGPVWPRGLYVGALVLVGGGLLAGHTRGAVTGVVAGVVVLLLTMRGGRAVIDFLLALVVVVMGAALAAGGFVVDYFERGEEEEQLVTLNSRTHLWETATDAIEQEPIFGYGVTSARGIFYDELGVGGGHNAVVNVFVELGLVGLVVWAALVVALVAGIGRLPVQGNPHLRLDRALLLGVLTFLMVDGIFFEGPGSVTNIASTWFFVCIAWLMVLKRSVSSTEVAHARARAPLRG